MSKLTFKQAKFIYLRKLEQYVPIVDRVHGEHHPEFHDVKNVFEDIIKKIKEVDDEKLDVKEEFSKLRTITDNYKVPTDVCETYEAVYNMLKALDEAYSS
jgi:regulator of cell morphogenesis and NO signaling